MKPFLIIGTIILLVGQLLAAEPETTSTAPITKEIARDAITVFRQDPLSPRGRAAGEIVRRFAEKSEDVILHVTPKVAPFLTNVELAKENRALLLDAFTVGNVDSQLLRNEKKDDPYAGVQELISTYRRVQMAVPTFNLPEVEKLVEMEKRGELKAYVTSP